MFVIVLGLERFLFFPFTWLEITAFLFQGAAAKGPSRTWGKCANRAEKRAILQNASASDIFAEALRIHVAQLRTNCQDRLRFSGKVKCVFGLMVVDSLQAEAIVEECCCFISSVGDHTMKAPVQ